MELPSRHVLQLAKKIGARAPGSDGEAAAASYVLRTMGDMDAEVDMENLRTWKSDTHGLLIVLLLGLIAYAVFPLSYVLSAVIAIVVFFVFQMETYSWAVTSRLMPRSSASNVIGRVHPSKDRKRIVVLTANYDSAKESVLGRPLAARLYRVIYIIAFACICVIGLLAIVGVLISLASVDRDTIMLIWMLTSPAPVYLFILTSLIAWSELFGRYSTGANDNASGVGVMLSVIEKTADNPPESTEVWGVATARGFAGGRGMIALLRRHRRQLREAWIINIDHVGTGQLSLLRREGVMFGFRPNRKLVRMAMLVARKDKIDLKKGRCRVKKSDAMVARVRGRRAITIACVKGGTYPGYRNTEDSLNGIDRETLDDVVSIVSGLIKEIDRMDRPKPTAKPVIPPSADK